MKVLFGIIWLIDLALGVFTFIAKGFRKSFTASDPTLWFSFLLYGCIIGSAALRWIWKRPLGSLLMASLPLVALLFWFLLDKYKNDG